MLTAAGERLTARRLGRDGLAAAGPARRRAGRPGRGAPRPDPHRVRPVHPAGVRLLPGAPAAGERRRPGEVPGRHRGHPRHGHRRDRARWCRRRRRSRWRCSATPTWPEAADAVPGLLPHRPVALEGMDARLVDVFRARRGDAAVPDLPRGQAGCSSRRRGTPRPRRGPRPPGSSPTRAAWTRWWSPAPRRAALWRIREDGAGLGGRTPADAPAWPGWEDAAVPPEQLGAYLRDFDALHGRARPGRTAATATSATAACTSASTSRSRPRRRRYRRFVVAAAQLVGTYGGSMSGEHGDGRARSELLPAMYSAEAHRASWPRSRRSSTRATCSTPACWSTRRRWTRTCGCRRPGRWPAGSASPTPTTAATCPPRCTAASGWASAGPTPPAAGGVMCPSYLATRDEKDSTRGRARVLQELANGTLVRGFGGGGGGRGAGPVPVLQGLLVATARPGSTWPPTRPRCCTSGTGAGRGRRPTTRWAGCPAGPGWPRARPGWPTPRCAPRAWPGWPSGWAGSTHGGRCRGSPRRPSAPGSPPGPGRRRAGDAGAAVGGHVHRLLHPRGRPGRRAGARGGRVRGADHGRAGVLRPDLDLHRPARRRPPAAAAQPATLWARRSSDGVPVVGLEPSCTAVLRGEITELLPDDPRACPGQAATRTLAELLTGTGDWEPPDLGGVRAVAQPHCHHHAVMGWHADSALLARAGAEVTAVGGCCGLAGNFGVERGHYDVSVAVAETALLPAVRAAGRRRRAGRRVLLPHPARPARRGQRHPPGPAAGQPPGGAACVITWLPDGLNLRPRVSGARPNPLDQCQVNETGGRP